MKLKSKAIIQLVINIILGISIFLPFTFMERRWISGTNYRYDSYESLLSPRKESLESILVVLIIILVITCIIYSILLINKSKSHALGILMYSPIALMVLFIIYTFSVWELYVEKILFGWYFILLLIIASVVISFISKNEIKEIINQEDQKKAVNTTPVKTDSADELAKYKALLDNGTITQEEFDAKKKQLLGL